MVLTDGILNLSQTPETGVTVAGVAETYMMSILSLRMSLEASSPALVGLLSVSKIFTLRGSFFLYSLIYMPPSLLIWAMALLSSHGEDWANAATGPVTGKGRPTKMWSFAAARAGLRIFGKVAETPMAPAVYPTFFMKSRRVMPFFFLFFIFPLLELFIIAQNLHPYLVAQLPYPNSDTCSLRFGSLILVFSPHVLIVFKWIRVKSAS